MGYSIEEKKEYYKIKRIAKRNNIPIETKTYNSNIGINGNWTQLGTGWGLTQIKAISKIKRRRI